MTRIAQALGSLWLVVLALAPGAALAREAAAAPPAGAPPARPSGEQIVDRHVEVSGGKAAYLRVRSRVETGRMDLVGLGIGGPFRTRQQAPDRVALEIELPGLGTLRSGSSDGVAWESNPITGPRVLAGAERAATLRASALHADALWRESYPRAECVGLETLEEREVYKVVLSPAEGRPLTNYYDRQSGLLVKSALVVETVMGDIPTETWFSDYRPVDGLLVAHRVRQKLLTMEQVLTIEKVAHNVELPPGAFEPPAEILGLLQAAPSPGPAPGR